MTLGQELRRLRLAQKITKRSLAASAGITEAAIWSIEHDRIVSPRLFMIADLAGALGVSLDALVRMVDHPPKDRLYVRQEPVCIEGSIL